MDRSKQNGKCPLLLWLWINASMQHDASIDNIGLGAKGVGQCFYRQCFAHFPPARRVTTACRGLTKDARAGLLFARFFT
jgi:hypothetical protein